MSRKLTKAFSGMMQSVNRINTRYARVGDNEGNILVTGRSGFIFVRVSGTAEVLNVFNAAIPQASLVVGLPVEIRTDNAVSNQWYVFSGVRDDNGLATTTGAGVGGGTTTVTNNLTGLATNGNTSVVAIKSANYTLTVNDSVVVFTATATATLPAAIGSGRTYRIICRAGLLTIDGAGSELVKSELSVTLEPNEDLIITDTASGIWE